MTLDEIDRLLYELWMAMSEEDRFLTCARLYEGEKALIERLAPAEYSSGALREFVFYHIHGFEMPDGARRQFERRG